MSKGRAQHAGGMFDHPGRLLVSASVIVLFLWRIFTDTPSWHELAVGVVCTALTVWFFANVLRAEALNLDLHARDLLQLWRIPWYILVDCGLITWLLLKDLSGQPVGSFYRTCGFKTSRHDPTLVGRTVLAVISTTMSPNSIVIGIDPGQSLMLFHQLERSAISTSTQAFGARP